MPSKPATESAVAQGEQELTSNSETGITKGGTLFTVMHAQGGREALCAACLSPLTLRYTQVCDSLS